MSAVTDRNSVTFLKIETTDTCFHAVGNNPELGLDKRCV